MRPHPSDRITCQNSNAGKIRQLNSKESRLNYETYTISSLRSKEHMRSAHDQMRILGFEPRNQPWKGRMIPLSSYPHRPRMKDHPQHQYRCIKCRGPESNRHHFIDGEAHCRFMLPLHMSKWEQTDSNRHLLVWSQKC